MEFEAQTGYDAKSIDLTLKFRRGFAHPTAADCLTWLDLNPPSVSMSLHEVSERSRGNHGMRGFSCRDQFLCMMFAQLTFREGLRDIETCLRSVQPKLYHAGFRGRIARSTLGDANHLRDWCIYADFAQVLIRSTKGL